MGSQNLGWEAGFWGQKFSDTFYKMWPVCFVKTKNGRPASVDTELWQSSPGNQWRNLYELTAQTVSRLGRVLRVTVNVQEGNGLKYKTQQLYIMENKFNKLISVWWSLLVESQCWKRECYFLPREKYVSLLNHPNIKK